MTPQYLKDQYMKEFETTVVEVKDGKFAILKDTIFYPNSGGQPHDIGKLVKEDGTEVPVIYVGKFEGNISHQIDGKLTAGDKVKCVIDWKRRYNHMKAHTAAHLVSGLISNKYGALITGNQLGEDKIRIDFNLEDYDREKLAEYIEEANSIIDNDLEVRDYEMTLEEVKQNPEMIKLASGLLPGIDVLRIVEIVGFDRQPDGGTHVKSLKEIGKLKFLKAENKGKQNKRMYFTVV